MDTALTRAAKVKLPESPVVQAFAFTPSSVPSKRKPEPSPHPLVAVAGLAMPAMVPGASICPMSNDFKPPPSLNSQHPVNSRDKGCPQFTRAPSGGFVTLIRRSGR